MSPVRARPSAFAEATADRRSAKRGGWSTSSGRAVHGTARFTRRWARCRRCAATLRPARRGTRGGAGSSGSIGVTPCTTRASSTSAASNGSVSVKAPSSSPLETMDGRRAAGDVLPTDQQHQHVVDAVAVDALRRRPAGVAAARLDPELVHLDVPVLRSREPLEQRAAARQDRRHRRAGADRGRRSARTSARCRRSARCSRGSGSAAGAARGRSAAPAPPRRRHGGAAGTARRRPCSRSSSRSFPARRERRPVGERARRSVSGARISAAVDEGVAVACDRRRQGFGCANGHLPILWPTAGACGPETDWTDPPAAVASSVRFIAAQPCSIMLPIAPARSSGSRSAIHTTRLRPSPSACAWIDA